MVRASTARLIVSAMKVSGVVRLKELAPQIRTVA